MKKLHLQLDDLQVESFSTHEQASLEGTVRAFITMVGPACISNSCDFCATLSDCETGCGCGGGTHGDATCEAYPTCLPTCAGWTCEFDTCGDCHTSNIC